MTRTDVNQLLCDPQFRAGVSRLLPRLARSSGATVYKTADQSVATNTLTNDTKLKFQVGGDEVRAFHATIFTGELTADTGGWAFQMTMTNGEGYWGLVSEENGDARAINDGYFAAGVVHPASVPIFHVSGTVKNTGSTTQTCYFQFAQGTNVGPPTLPVTVKAYSHLTHRRAT